MTWTDLPRPWALAWNYAGEVCERYERYQGHALHIAADGIAVYPRLMLPKKVYLEAEARLFSYLYTTQTELYREIIVRLAAEYPSTHQVVVSLLWGGLEGAQVRTMATFGVANERAA